MEASKKSAKAKVTKMYLDPAIIEWIKHIQDEIRKDFKGINTAHTGRPGKIVLNLS